VGLGLGPVGRCNTMPRKSSPAGQCPACGGDNNHGGTAPKTTATNTLSAPLRQRMPPLRRGGGGERGAWLPSVTPLPHPASPTPRHKGAAEPQRRLATTGSGAQGQTWAGHLSPPSPPPTPDSSSHHPVPQLGTTEGCPAPVGMRGGEGGRAASSHPLTDPDFLH